MRAESYWHEQTVCPDTGSVIMGLPFSQQLVMGAAFVVDVCERPPGLRAPEGAPVPEPPLGLNDGAFVAEIGD